MLEFLARRGLDAFAQRYDYDVGYMRAMLDASPSAFFKFSRVTALATHRDAAPKEAYFAAKLVGALFEDCGPCVQLVIDMAREAKIDPAQIEAVLVGDVAAMNADASLGYRFADAVARRADEADDLREEVRARWGEKGLLDLAFALQVGRLFPLLKGALGYAKECRRVRIGDRPVNVVPRAA